MARKAKAAKAASSRGAKTNGVHADGLIPEDQLASAPDGFEEVFGERVVGWWALVPGNTIQGILRDTFETKSKFTRGDGTNKKKVYKVELTVGGAKVIAADSEDDEPVIKVAGVGDLVGVDEKGFLKALARVSVGQEIWVGYRGKEGPTADYPQGRHVFVGPRAKPAKINPVTGEVTS